MNHHDGTFTGTGNLLLYEQGWVPDGVPHAAIALVHGYGEHAGRYRQLVSYLVAHGYGVHTFDLRGHGRSPGARGHIMSWDEYRADLGIFLDLVRTRIDAQPLFLYGHSLGGLVVLDYALHRPCALAGVIASAPLLAQPAVSPLLLRLSRVLSRVRPTFSLDTHTDAATLSRDLDVVSAYREDILVHSRASARLGTEVARVMAETITAAPTLTVPLLLLFGSADHLVPRAGSERFFARVEIADKRCIVYQGGYHEPHNDLDRCRVFTDVETWLGNHLPVVARDRPAVDSAPGGRHG